LCSKKSVALGVRKCNGLVHLVWCAFSLVPPAADRIDRERKPAVMGPKEPKKTRRSRILKGCNGFNSLIRSFVLGKTVQTKKTSNIVSSRAERAAPARRFWHRVLSLKSPIPRRQSSNLQIHVGRNCGTVVLLNNDVVVTEGWLSQLIGLASVAPTTEMSREADLGVSTTEHTETTEIGGEGQTGCGGECETEEEFLPRRT
jgi:hypothetical protein